jgi:hypothetical protein
MDSITRNLVSKTVSTKKLMYTAFTTLPTEIQLEILDYIPRKVVFQPNELVYLKHFYIYLEELKNDREIVVAAAQN